MEPVEGALKLAEMVHTLYFDSNDVEVGIGIALLSESRTEAISLANRYVVKRLLGKTVTGIYPDAFSKAVGWLWKVLNDEGRAMYDSVVEKIRIKAENLALEENPFTPKKVE